MKAKKRGRRKEELVQRQRRAEGEEKGNIYIEETAIRTVIRREG